MIAIQKFMATAMVCLLLPGAWAADRENTRQPDDRNPVFQAKRSVARTVAALLDDPVFQLTLSDALALRDQVSMGELLATYQAHLGTPSAKAQDILETDRAVREWKGTERLSDGLMQLRLIRADNGPLDPASLLVAFEPQGNDRDWTEVLAYDASGALHRLDAHQRPDFPVLVADLDSREDLRSGIALANEMLVAAGMQTPVDPATAPFADKACAGIETAKLTYIRLNDDQEPWIKGAAEVYAFVSGIDPTIADPEIRVVDMPYLDNDGTNYYPNQLLVYWYQYRYYTVNVSFYEHDDGTNYQEILSAVISGVRTILGVFAPEYAIIAEVANAILQAMPASWFTDDDDYVDTVYTVAKSQLTGSVTYHGAGNNVTMTLAPHCLE